MFSIFKFPCYVFLCRTSVSSAHAKLSLRDKVEIWDACTAIMLCEEALAASTGYSILKIQPNPHLSTKADLHDLLGRKVFQTIAVIFFT